MSRRSQRRYDRARAAFYANPSKRNTNRLGLASYRHHKKTSRRRRGLFGWLFGGR